MMQLILVKVNNKKYLQNKRFMILLQLNKFYIY